MKEDERYLYFLIFACNKVPTTRNKKRIINVVKAIKEKDIYFGATIINTLLDNVSNKLYQWAIYTLSFEYLVSNLDKFEYECKNFPMWLKLKIQDRKCGSHHAYKNNYWNSMLGLELEEATENGD